MILKVDFINEVKNKTTMNSFIKLTSTKDKTIILNITHISSIQEIKHGSYITMAFKESNSECEVKETPKEIMKLIEYKII